MADHFSDRPGSEHANDGTQSVTMPNITNSTCRIKIEAVGNIFFDIRMPTFR